MALPDYLGYGNALAMVSERKEDVERAFRLQTNATNIVTAIAARALHPMTAKLGRFTIVPTKEKLENILQKLKGMKDDARKTAELFASLKIPEFENKTQYLALIKGKDYPLYDGKISSLEGIEFNPQDYRKFLKEEIKIYSTAKHVSFNEKNFMVGALARLNINHKYLSDTAKELLEKSGIKLPSYNPFVNNFAQALEIVHFLDKGIEIVEDFLATGLKSEEIEIKPREGEGIAVGEAPRGVLYHHYSLDNNGIIKYANIITPTAQNLKNAEEDIKKFLPNILSLPKNKIVLELEKLIRAYDPCISCSTHFLEVKFI
jgi:coenzyme F420-reducing hydrogenase alpha subunit